MSVFKILFESLILITYLACCLSWNNPYSRHDDTQAQKMLRNFNRYYVQESSQSEDSEEFHISPRIVGGRPAAYGDIPSQLYVLGLDEFRCGANLIDVKGLRFALTAAHCVWIGDPDPDSIISHKVLQVVGGDTNILYVAKTDRFFNVSKTIMHQHYDPRWDMNDLAILFLASYAFEGMGLHSIPLPELGWDEPHFVQISGWGSLVWQGKPSHDLQYIVIPTIHWETCRLLRLADRGHNISRANICVSPKGFGIYGTCHGDSGGPALGYNDTNFLWHLVGVASFVISDVCGDPRNAAGYVRVSYYVDWIRATALAYKAVHGTGNPYTNGTH